MRILVVGGGGREHALTWKLAQSANVDKIFAAPGNAGMAELAQCEPMAPTDAGALADFAEAQSVDLTVVGPEAPLVAGVADEFSSRGLAVFGPSAAAARIEGSKAFAKQIMQKAGIATAHSRAFTKTEDALDFLRSFGTPCVVKADGLAAGKGVRVCETLEDAAFAVRDCLDDDAFGAAGRTVVIEECLRGEELSAFALTDGKTVLTLPSAQDHKRLGDGDAGPNTGGMGAYAPVPHVAPGDVAATIFTPLVRTLETEGIPYQGLIFAGLMVDGGRTNVLEFNCRFGDPETQALLPLLESDLAALLLACAQGNLAGHRPQWSSQASACVILAGKGYPERSDSGTPIQGLEAASATPGVQVFHAGTAERDGRVVTNGGRVLGVTGAGADLDRARERAYEAISKIAFDGMQFRRDIGAKAQRGVR